MVIDCTHALAVTQSTAKTLVEIRIAECFKPVQSGGIRRA
jgi:hypothetical protein